MCNKDLQPHENPEIKLEKASCSGPLAYNGQGGVPTFVLERPLVIQQSKQMVLNPASGNYERLVFCPCATRITEGVVYCKATTGRNEQPCYRVAWVESVKPTQAA